MSVNNWGIINNGGIFESLMHAILYAEDQNISLFCRSGKDDAIDAKSADGTHVYQAKYRKEMSMDIAIDLARKELEKIGNLREKKNSHWTNVAEWTLFANFEKNPNDEKKWQDVVVPLFKEEGLIAYFRGIESMDQALLLFPHIKEGFFEGKNRVLISAFEAKEMSISKGVCFDNPIRGREAELKKAENFLKEKDSKILKISGVSGIGKTRFLHQISDNCSRYGYIPIWGLSKSLKYSDNWFKTYNINDNICLIIDDFSEIDLFRALIEQLGLPERRKWRLIFSARPAFIERVNPFIESDSDLISLSSLNGEDSKQVFKDINFAVNEEHIRYECAKLSAGLPSNIFLLAKMFFNEGQYTAEFLDAHLMAQINSALNGLDPISRNNAYCFLRYIALWGEVNLEDSEVKEFLYSKQIHTESLHEIKKILAKNKLIRLWGYEERFCKISSAMLRDTIISAWLLDKDSSENYYITGAGKDVIKAIYNGDFPMYETALATLSDTFCLRKIDQNPFHDIYKDIEEKIKSQDIANYLGLLQTLSKVIFADPNHSLDILIEARKRYEEQVSLKNEVLANCASLKEADFSIIPSLLLKLLKRAENKNFARSLLNELSHFITLNPSTYTFGRNINNENLSKAISSIIGNYPEVFVLDAACEYICKDIGNGVLTDISTILAKSILRTKIDLRAQMISRYACQFGYAYIPPNSFIWKKIIELKDLLFKELKTAHNLNLRIKIWDIIDSFHSDLDRTIVIGKKNYESYINMRDGNLLEIRTILLSQKKNNSLSIKEASVARKVWDWYFYRDDYPELQKIAIELDSIISDVSKWNLKEIFKLRTSKDSRGELEKCANQLDKIDDVQKFDNFFKEVKDYLAFAGNDYAYSALYDIVKEMKISFSGRDTTPLDQFILKTFYADKNENLYAWDFALRFLESYILNSKNSKNNDYIEYLEKSIFQNSKNVESIFYDLYGNAHPQTIGDLKVEELNLLRKNKDNLQPSIYFWVLVVFSVFFWEQIVSELVKIIEELKKLDEKDAYIKKFIRVFDFISLRYDKTPSKEIIEFVISKIKEYNLDSDVLKSYELERLREASGYKFSLNEFLEFIKIRLRNERNNVPRPINSHSLSYDLNLKNWIKFDSNSETDKDAFKDLCDLIFEDDWNSSYYLPEYIASIDVDADLLPKYLKDALSVNPEDERRVKHCAVLISKYKYGSDSWIKCAKSILPLMKNFSSRKKKEFFWLMKDSFKSYSAPVGTVAECFYRDVELAQKQYDNESDIDLKEYFEWDLMRAKQELEYEKKCIEEQHDD